MIGRTTIWLISLTVLASCAASRQRGAETANGRRSQSELEQRYEELEASAEDLDVATIIELPEVSDDDRLYVLESVIGAPPIDQSHGGYVVLPPRDWTIGNSAEGEEIRMTFLQPGGGDMVIHADDELELPDEVSAIWIVRYERRNVLLTEGGTAMAVHVVPLAVRIEVPDGDPLYWVSPEAFEP